jgi:hypothetical protein
LEGWSRGRHEFDVTAPNDDDRSGARNSERATRN